MDKSKYASQTFDWWEVPETGGMSHAIPKDNETMECPEVPVNILRQSWTTMQTYISGYVLHSDTLQQTIANELRRTNFQGASGHIKFNEYQEVLTEIDISKYCLLCF